MISAKQLKSYRSLKIKKYRKLEGKFIIEGKNLCEAALGSNFPIELILMSRKFAENRSNSTLLSLINETKTPFEISEENCVNSLCDSVTPPGIAAIVFIPERKPQSLWELSPEVVLILDRITDPGNLGTIIRSADWFGVKAVLCSKDCVDLYNGKVLRSSAGSIFHVPLIIESVDIVDIIDQMTAKNYTIFVADQNSVVSYTKATFKPPKALVVGNERQGVRREIQRLNVKKIAIPKKGRAESLNAAVAASILLAELSRNETNKSVFS